MAKRNLPGQTKQLHCPDVVFNREMGQEKVAYRYANSLNYLLCMVFQKVIGFPDFFPGEPMESGNLRTLPVG